MANSYLELQFDVFHKTGCHAQYADDDLIRLEKSNPNAFFGNYKLPSSRGKEEFGFAHFVCLYKLETSYRDSNNVLGVHRKI